MSGPPKFFAVVDEGSNKVVNTILLNDEDDWPTPVASRLVEVVDDEQHPGVGWSHNPVTEEFTPPPSLPTPPEPRTTTPQNRLTALVELLEAAGVEGITSATVEARAQQVSSRPSALR